MTKTKSEIAKDYYQRHKNDIKEKSNAYYHSNKEKCCARQKAYKERNAERSCNTSKIYKQKNKERRNTQNRYRYGTDPQYRMSILLRTRLNEVLTQQKTFRSQNTFELLGCDREFLVKYLESKFTEGMSWELKGKIHIDHIRPICTYDLTDPEQQKKCFHYTNLQPLWKKKNLEKGRKYVTVEQV